jgi:phospholipase/carboxylesterase
VPILMCHGREDPVLPMSLGTTSRDWLRGLGYAVKWKEYRMQHQVCAEEIGDISDWLEARLTAVPAGT